MLSIKDEYILSDEKDTSINNDLLEIRDCSLFVGNSNEHDFPPLCLNFQNKIYGGE
jgi:hypothetical protein